MNDTIEKLKLLNSDLKKAKAYFLKEINNLNSSVHIYTHIDADGLASGAILGKALYREKIPFQITILRQLEREEIIKIIEKTIEYKNFVIFSDFGSGQYQTLQKQWSSNDVISPFIILDHHIPQNVANKEDIDSIKEIHEQTSRWHINPYFFGINGSDEISGAGMCYYFAKCLNKNNIDLSAVAIVGAVGDIQNKEQNKSFKGINTCILNDAKNSGLLEIKDDLNFSPINPLNNAIAYSYDINLPGLTNDVNRTLKFLQTLGILVENSDGSIKRLIDLSQDEKKKLSSAIIKYASVKLDIEPYKIVRNLIVNRYILKNELFGTHLYYSKEFSYLLNACGRTNNGSLGIAIAMGERESAYQSALDILGNYRKSLGEALNWIIENNKIKQMEHIQYFFGEEIIPENIIGTVASILTFDKSDRIDKSKPIFGLAKREDQEVYKVSGRAEQRIVKLGVNLSEAIREALALTKLDALGGGHPPAAGTKVPIDKIEEFLDNINNVIKNQIQLS